MSTTSAPCNPATFTWPHLKTITSGYGATVTYAYTSLPDPAGAHDRVWVRAASTQRSTAPGVGATQTQTFAYTGDPQYKVVNTSNRWLDEYRGFGQVRETDASSNYVDHWYYTYNSDSTLIAEKGTGREWKTEWRNSGGVLLRQALYTWTWTHCCVGWTSAPEEPGDYNSRVSWFVYLTQQDTATGSKTARTRFTYDMPTDNGGSSTMGYGNKLRENRDGDLDVGGDDATLF